MIIKISCLHANLNPSLIVPVSIEFNQKIDFISLYKQIFNFSKLSRSFYFIHSCSLIDYSRLPYQRRSEQEAHLLELSFLPPLYLFPNHY